MCRRETSNINLYLFQGPYGGRPVLKRVIIVTPSSLVSNWGKEFNKWLGKEKIAPFIVDQQNKVYY